MRTRAFSLIEVLISIVVLALGLLGIAAVFPAVVTQQRATTDAVQGGSLQESVREYIRTHRLLNRASLKQNTINGVLQPVARADLRGWQLLVDNENWSEPLAPNYGVFDGEFQLGSDVTQPGLNTDRGSAITWILNGDGTQPGASPGDPALLNEPVAWISVTERQLPVWPTAAGSPVRPDTQYVWDFTARRLGAGIPFPTRPGATLIQQRLSLQDDSVQLAVFIRRKDKTSSRNAVPVPVGEDNNGRPTYDGTGTYSLIRSAVYTLPGFNYSSGTGATNILKFNTGLTNGRYLAQVGQKLVDQWGVVHEVTRVIEPFSDTDVTLEIRATTQRVDPATNQLNEGVKVGNAKAYMDAGVPLRMIFTNQIPVSVSVFDVRPSPIPRT